MQEILVGERLALLGERIGKGGEGEVFALKGNSGLAVKIYKSNLRADREDKIRAMVGGGLAAKTDLVAYPGRVVFDPSGNFVGFLMRLVSGYSPIHELYSPKSRQRHFPKADYRFIIRAALNFARAVGKVHQTGCVIGDLNHSGVLVSQTATVALIDADSFQFRLGEKMYPCVVGVPDFTPPELHGANLKTVERTTAHDNFGLAVAIFHLLFMGRHPYAGRYSGPDLSIGDAIAQNRFAFSIARNSETHTTPPPGALTLDRFPAMVGDAFEWAFGTNPGARPPAPHWVSALTQLESLLTHCGNVRSHFYPTHAHDCVWCDLTGISGFDMFPDLSITTPNIATDTQGTEQAIRDIQAFRFPTVSDLVAQATAPRSNGSLALIEAKSSKRGTILMGALLILGALVGLMYATPLWFVWLGIGFWGFARLSDRAIDVAPFRVAFLKADEEIQRQLDSFVQRNGLTEVMKVRGELDPAITSYKSLESDLARELSRLSSTREARQRSAYLDQFSVRQANISGIGPAKTAMLISFGIETAADVNRSSVLRVPGFGDVMTAKIVDWMRRHEARFRYNPTPNAQDTADQQAVRTKFAYLKVKLETIIRTGLNTLRSAKPRLDSLPSVAQSDQALVEAIKVRAQAEQDLKLLGAHVSPSTVTLKTTSPTPPNQSTSGNPPTSTRQTGSQGVPDCPQCGAMMRRRSGRYGNFWGCSRYPKCRGTRNF